MNSKVFEYPNGIRLVYLPGQGVISHCGLMIGAGSRDEAKGKEGLAHFIEHLLFKGTKKRKAYQILNRLEIVGGELNAYTTKEETCIHASMLHEHFERSAELIADIVFNSTYPDAEIAKEKDVVIDEINSYKDSPSEQIYDDFESLVFRNQPLGNPVLGTPESVINFTRSDIVSFTKNNYSNNRMVFSYTGSLPFETIKKIVGRYFNRYKRYDLNGIRSKTRTPRSRQLINTRSASHAHYITGSAAYSGHSAKRFPLFLLNNILGGPGLNSRLNMNIREKFGLTYHIESGYVPFNDTGLFNVYFACEKRFLEKCILLVDKELIKLKENRISSGWLSRYKYQLKGQIAIAQENRAGVMINNAKSILSYNKPIDIPEVFRKIDAVTSTQMLDVANELFSDRKMSSLLFDPVQ